MHVPPAVRRWGTRLGLAIVVAMVIGYLPGQILQRDPRTVTLERQLGELATEQATLTVHNAELMRAIDALRSDVGAIEARARADLGMAYPDELVLRIAPLAVEVTP
jgi:cell division protein FtsB